jgi:hypothetical protein
VALVFEDQAALRQLVARAVAAAPAKAQALWRGRSM